MSYVLKMKNYQNLNCILIMSVDTFRKFRRNYIKKLDLYPSHDLVFEISKNMAQLYDPINSTPQKPVYRDLYDGETQTWNFRLYKIVRYGNMLSKDLIHHEILPMNKADINRIRYFITTGK